MNIGALKTGAMIAGVTIGGGALIGGGAGAVSSLSKAPDPSSSGITTMEKREVLKNVLIGAGAGAIGGVTLVGAKKVLNVAPLKSLPLMTMGALGGATGAASYGAFTLGRNGLN